MGYDGWVVVGTKLDSKQLEKDLKNSERKLSQYEKEAEKLTKLKAKAEVDLEPYEEQKRLIQEMTDEMNSYAQTAEEVSNNLAIEQSQLEELNVKYSKQRENLDEINKKIQENAKNQAIVKQEIQRTNEQLGNAKNFDSIKGAIAEIGKSTGKAIKSVAKWALAIFGLRTAYNAVRRAMSTLSRYNEQIAVDIEYMSFAIAKTLEPLIQSLIQLAFKLMNYVNYIAQAWFGVNLFANASADAMNKSANSAEKMRKSLAGFDEMNVVSDNSASASSNLPSVDLSQMQGEVPSWLKWIADNKELITGVLTAITTGLFAIKLGLGGIMGLGIGLLIGGLVYTIQELIEYLNDPTWDNYADYLFGLGIIVAGLALLIGGPTGLIVGIIAAVLMLVAVIIKNWDKIKSVLITVGTWIYDNIVVPVIKFFEAMFDTIWSIIKLWFSYIKGIFATIIGLITNPFIVAKETIIGIFNGIKTFFQGFAQVVRSLFNGDIAGVLDGFKLMFKGIMDSLWAIAKAPLNLIIGGINSLINGLNKISFDVPEWLGGGHWGINIPKIPRLAVGGIINMPGRGVPLPGAVGGENGAEGVLPLTDSQAMETLGATIGKYITINASIVNTMNGRVISRELKKINNDNDFAFNR